MRKRTIFLTIACGFAALVLAVAVPSAQGDDGNGAGSGGSTLTADELQKLVAPVALYPDKLLSNVLRAATSPLQIVEAERYLGSQSSGGDADESQTKNWDTSVQALLHYPKVVKEMSDKLDWTTQLGQAVIHQQKDVMAAVQADRARAAQQGALKTNDQVQVNTEPAPASSDGSQTNYYTIESTSASTTYVPTYNPTYLYPGYSGAAMAVAWGAGVATGAWLAGGFHWNSGDITVNRNVNAYGYHAGVWHHPDSVNNAWRAGARGPDAWRNAGGIGSFGSPRGPGGIGGPGGVGRPGGVGGPGGLGRPGGVGGPGGAGRPGGVGGPGGAGGFGGWGDGRGGGFNGGSPGSHFGGFGDGGSGMGRSAFSGMGGGGFGGLASDRGGFSRGGFGGGFGGGGGFRGGRRR